jgi:hypothetical protein
MTAKVRIAPVERWCEHARRGEELDVCRKLVGLVVEILPSSMGVDERCPGARVWLITDESRDRLFAAVDRIVIPVPWRLCEHMLEMD